MMEWAFRTEGGKRIDPIGIIFPLTSHETPESPFQIIGTAFMIGKPGIFLTARHCLFKDNQYKDPWNDLIGVIHHAYHVKWSTYVDQTDVAIGQLDMGDVDCAACLDHKVMSLCTWTPIEKEIICHWGCELSEIDVTHNIGDDYFLSCALKLRGHNGHFIEKLPKHPPFTHSSCHVTTASIPHAASGGPVTLSTGQVCAISSSGSDGGGYTIASLVSHALNSNVPPHFRLNNEIKGRRQTFEELLSEFGLKVLKGV